MKVQQKLDAQHEHDTTITEEQRNQAINSFLKKTGFDGGSDDDGVGQSLREFAKDRHKKESKKREQKRKRKETSFQKKHEQERIKKDFIRQIEENSIKANNPLIAL